MTLYNSKLQFELRIYYLQFGDFRGANQTNGIRGKVGLKVKTEVRSEKMSLYFATLSDWYEFHHICIHDC